MTGTADLEQAPTDVTRQSPRVTVAILNYNGREFLDVVIPSVFRQSFGDIRVIVIDNGSSDGSVDHIRAQWSAVQVVEIPDNIGVAAALNRAVEAGNGEFIALLNNDVELEPGWLVDLVGALEAHPDAASASGKLLRFDDRTRIDAAGDVMLWSSAVVNRGSGEVERGQYDEPQPIFAACAGAALYRQVAFDIVGPFDESFFAYLEDIDWAVRAQLRGLGSRYVPTARAYHVRGATTRRHKGFYARLGLRNQVLLVVKNFPASALLRHGWKIALNQGLAVAASARDGIFREHVRAWRDVALRMPHTLRARRDVQRSRVAGVRELDAIIGASMPPFDSRRQRLLYELAPVTIGRRRERAAARASAR